MKALEAQGRAPQGIRAALEREGVTRADLELVRQTRALGTAVTREGRR